MYAVVSPYTGSIYGIQYSNMYGNFFLMKSTKVQTSPIYRNHALNHLPQSTDQHAVSGSKYVMAKPAQFVKLSSLVVSSEC